MASRLMGGKVVLITGASSGIGEALARECARNGASVVLAARRKERLDRITGEVRALGGEALAVKTDVSKEDDVRRLVAAAVKRFKRIDVLVNNAARGVFGPVENIPSEEMHRTFDVNFFGMFYCCREVIPVMKRQGKGHIINISSIAGIMALPLSSAYNATKFAMNGFSESLRRELSSFKIDVSVVYPGSVETEFYGKWVNVHSQPPRKQSDILYQDIGAVARAIVRCIRSPRDNVFPSLPLRLAASAYRICPSALDIAMRVSPSIFDATGKGKKK